MPHHRIESVLTMLQEELHPPMARLVSELARQPWATGLRYDLSRQRLWIARRDIGRLEVMVTYGDGQGGGRPSNLELDAYETTIFENWIVVETVTLRLMDSIARIRRWLTEANDRRPESERLRDAAEAASPISRLRDAWLVGDKRARVLLATRLNSVVLVELATVGLAACSRAVNDTASEIAEVVRVGGEVGLWSQGHKAFDGVRELTLAADGREPDRNSPRYALLFVAENAARLVYNASAPSDPFDDDSAESFLHAVFEFLMCLPIEKRAAVVASLTAVSVDDS